MPNWLHRLLNPPIPPYLPGYCRACGSLLVLGWRGHRPYCFFVVREREERERQS